MAVARLADSVKRRKRSQTGNARSKIRNAADDVAFIGRKRFSFGLYPEDRQRLNKIGAVSKMSDAAIVRLALKTLENTLAID